MKERPCTQRSGDEVRRRRAFAAAVAVSMVLAGCAGAGDPDPADGSGAGAGVQAFVGATIIDGRGSAAVAGGVILARDGIIEAVGPGAGVEVPAGAEIIDLEGRWIVPGFINAHGHVSGDLTAARSQLEQYAYYGVTTVVSLGEEPETGQLRDGQAGDTGLNRSRIFVSGPVIAPTTPEEARADVEMLADLNVDWVKTRIDDGLGTRPKPPPEVWGEVIAAAEEHGLPAAIHIVDLADAIGIVEAGVALVAHSVRDAPVNDVLIDAMLEADVCLVPTLTREVSTFTYAQRPDFFDDPFFLERAAPSDLSPFQTPEFRASQQTDAALFWEDALPLAMANMKALHDAGVGIAMGTDTGPFARFQGYFEHMEMEMMADAGLSPAEVIHASTGGAAECMGLAGSVGTLETGAYADLVVLNADPLADIANTREIESVWVSGNRVR